MLHKDYDRNVQLEKVSGHEREGPWRQDELIGTKQAIVE
jgi:hypothetical protein